MKILYGGAACLSRAPSAPTNAGLANIWRSRTTAAADDAAKSCSALRQRPAADARRPRGGRSSQGRCSNGPAPGACFQSPLGFESPRGFQNPMQTDGGTSSGTIWEPAWSPWCTQGIASKPTAIPKRVEHRLGTRQGLRRAGVDLPPSELGGRVAS